MNDSDPARLEQRTVVRVPKGSSSSPRTLRRWGTRSARACVFFCALLGTSAVAAVAAPLAAACPSVEFVGVRGSGEHSNFGSTIGAVLSGVNGMADGVGNKAIDYPAINVPNDPLTRSYRDGYVDSVAQGVEALHDFVATFQQKCGGTPLLLSGYSQGAEVVDDWLMGALSNGQRANVAGVALFGDPRFNPAQVLPVDVGTFNHRFGGIGIYQFQPPIGTFGTLVSYPVADAGLVRSYCANHDPVCNFSSPALAISCGRDNSCAHLHYMNLKVASGSSETYTTAAADFLVGRWRQLTGGGGNSGGPTGDGPGAGDPGGGTPGGGSPGGGAPPPPPAPTYAETSGSVVHTWTDYADAGGTGGPEIPSNATVQIQCKVSGFAVADGNTWWYQVASSPWNDTYYASADAFYNDGATSGSLSGTPFDDPNVPDCAGSGGGSNGGKPYPTYAETSGSVVHTWTDYADAGGTEGPEIPSNATVQIECKLTGFAVADGNTWWYQVASSPWNDTYYASADAFYNNGATSGSLSGTPFDDPNVPDC